LLRFVQEIQETRVSARDLDDQVDDLAQDLVQVEAAADRLADLLKNLELAPRQIQCSTDAVD
jgi:hypothetical protein